MRYGECPDYDDFKISIENGVVLGKNFVRMGSVTDAKTLGDGKNIDACIEDSSYDVKNEMFVGVTQNDSPMDSSSSDMIPQNGVMAELKKKN